MPLRIPDCHPDRKHKAFGLCTSCYQRKENKGKFKTLPKKINTCGHYEKKHCSNGMCQSCYHKHLMKINPVFNAKQKKNHKDWTAKNPDKVKANQIKSKSKPGYRENKIRLNFIRDLKVFGFTEIQFYELLEYQKNSCAICLKPFPQQVLYYRHTDHDHTTNRIRGILCNGCNRGLGFFGDNIEGITKVLGYINGR